MNQNAEKRKDIESIYTLSPIQQGMLFHTVYAPNSGVYVEQKLFTIWGQVNVVNLKQAWQKVIERHSVLRTLFVWEKQEKPLQVVLKQIDLPWHDCDWQNIPPQEQQQRLEELLQQDRYQGFTLNQAPLMRFTLIQLGEHRYQFLWSHHHILMDGWCLPIIVKEVLTFYEAYNVGKTPSLPSPRPYRDYITWLQKQDLSQAEAFWQRNLQSFKTPTPLVVDKLAVQDSQEYPTYPKYELSLSSEVTQALQTIAKQQSITLATLVQAAWAVLLSRYSGEKEVLFGVTVSGRSGDLVGIEEMVGLFINTLPLRVDVTREKSVLEFLQQVQKKSVELQEYTYISLAEVQRLSEVPATIPLFESIVVFENYPVDKSLQESKYSFDVTAVEAFEQTNYPLAVLVFAQEELSIKISYDSSRFTEATIARLGGHFQTLLTAIAANPEQPVAELPLLTKAEQHQLLVEWNQTNRDYPPDKCLHHLFEEQVKQTPDAIAVEVANQQLTYQQLNQKANQLAHYLQSLGVEPEVLVGIAVERSLEMAITVLAVLKAGGAYVPIDPAYPQERRDFMLADTSCRVLISQSSLKSLFSQVNHLVLVDEQQEIINQQPVTNLNNPVQPNNLLYVIYTSGSTDRPKGITLSHQALGNLIYWHLETMNQGVGVLQFASLSFDASFHEMFAAWCSGGTLYMIPETLRLDVEKLVDFLATKPIQKAIFPVALWQQIAQIYEQQPELFRHLTEIVTTGEQLQITQPIINLCKQLQHCRLHNHYGPSETHVVTSFIFNDLPDTWPIYPPIGKPIANTQIYILDQYGQPVPIGVPGFLLIGGANLARGYLHRPDLTSQKFVNNPFGQGLLYQTGDQARYLPDGNIEFIGRVDDQVKLRGFRVELGEVEAVLNKHPNISQAVVTVQGTLAQEKRLVGYVVTKPSEKVTTEDLRQFLLHKLPDYMIPSAFVTLESLPLTPNQKVDRRALPLPDLQQINLDNQVAPRTPTEEIIANIFASVLKLEQVGINDNFFTLGGHSLLATQAISRLRSSFKIDVPLRTLFTAPTVAELAQAIGEMLHQAAALVVPQIEGVSNRIDILPLSWSQERLWFLDQLEGQNAIYNIPIALKISGNLNIAALEAALTEIIQRHEILRTTFTTVDGVPRQAIASPTSVKIPVVKSSPDQIPQAANQAAKQPFDLSRDSLIRFQLLQLTEENHVLFVTVHHIIFDAWSMSIFVRELITLYEAALNQKSDVLPSLPIQYADFAYWQRQWLQGEALEKQLLYWKQQLQGTLPLLQLPIDYPLTPTQNYQGAEQSLRLSKSLTSAIKNLSRQGGTTVFMTLLATFKLLLSRHTGQEDIIIGAPIAGRNYQQTEELIGCFLNTLPLRTDLSGNPSFRKLLTRVREITLAAYSHQDIPFEKLVEEIKPERSLNRHPVFDVIFNMLNTPAVNLEIPGLSFEPLTLTQLDSKFFLTLFVQEQAEELNIKLIYRQNLFAPERINNLLEQFEYLLQQITTQPDRPIQSYSLVTPPAQSLLPDFSIPLDQPEYEPVTTLFINWAQQTPQQPAIRQNGKIWTYQKLAQTSQNIALVLVNHGVQLKDVVAVYGTRNLELIASIIGVFLSGAVLLILDSNLPLERSQLMLEQAQTKYLLIVGEQPESELLTASSVKVIYLDLEITVTDEPETTCGLPKIKPEDYAYIFFTSGSTSTPKGVLGDHKGISHFLQWQRQTLNINTQDRIAQLTSLTFDAILRDIFLPLTSGATLCLPDPDHDLGADRVLNWLEQEQITLIHTVPTVAHSWLTQVKQQIHLSSLRWIFFSGEPLTNNLVKQWRETFGTAAEIINLYGATETTMVKCFYPVPKEMITDVMPGGWPLPQTQILVLNTANQLCGIGEIGEIIIRTPFRTLGYINAITEQQQRFVPNPVSNDPEDLFYYTGDKGRYHPNGVIEILGRQDDQIKIRGVRIQPGEIEAALNQHPAVAKSVVIATDEALEDKRLIAYVVPKPNQTLASRDLYQFLKKQLPDYLIPSNFVFLETFPLTASGKVDRRALPAPSLPATTRTYIAPRNQTEETIVGIFASVLKLEQISIDDHFFELGGHSLLATQVISRLREAFKINLPLRTLFTASTPAELAVAIDEMKVTKDAEIDTPKITKIDRQRRKVQISSPDELTLPDSIKQEIFSPETKH